MFLKIILVVFFMSTSLAQTCDEEYLDNVAFLKLGTYRKFFITFLCVIFNHHFFMFTGGATNCGTTFQKSYYLPKYFKATWVHTRNLCQSYGMESLSLETKAETDNFWNLLTKNTQHIEELTHIGGVVTTLRATDAWYWVNSGKKANYPLKFAPGTPDGNGYCLAILKRGTEFFFKDITCHTHYEIKFICQRDEL